MKKFEYDYNEIVIGSSLESVLFSCMFNIPILLIDREIFSDLERISNSQRDLIINLFKQYSFVTTRYEQKNIKKQLLYDFLCFVSSMRGNIISSDVVQSIRYSETENRLTVVTENSRTFFVKANNFYIFDMNESLKGFAHGKVGQIMLDKNHLSKYNVIDRFKTSRIKKIEVRSIIPKDGISEEIQVENFSTVYCHMILTHKQLESFEYSSIVTNKYLLSMLKPHIVRYDIKQNRHKPKLNFIERKIKRIKSGEREKIGNITYDDREFETILSIYKRPDRAIYRTVKQ